MLDRNIDFKNIPHCWNCGSHAYWNSIKDSYECSVCGATTCPHYDVKAVYSWISNYVCTAGRTSCRYAELVKEQS
jgi:hypothetical protein